MEENKGRAIRILSSQNESNQEVRNEFMYRNHCSQIIVLGTVLQ